MNIVLEGPDGSGKSTLAELIRERLRWKIIHSQGPEKFPEEIHDRIARYLTEYRNRFIFDRHPVISQSIYSIMGNQNMPKESDEVEFYQMDNLFIYCRPNNPLIMERHKEREDVDTKEYVKILQEKYSVLVDAYDLWAMKWAHMIYRIGDDTNRLIGQIKGALSI